MSLLKDLLGDNDRRRDLRYPCQLSAVMETEQGSLECEVLSLSSSGLSARCHGPLEKGQAVAIRVEDEAPLQCRVEWGSRASSDNLVRLSFQETLEGSYWAGQLESLAQWARESRQRRGGVRVKCRLPAQLTLPDGQQREALLLDLGTTGARVRCEGEALPEALLMRFGPLERLPAIEVEVKVIHDDEAGHYGVFFSSFHSGGLRDTLDYVNQVFQPRRAGQA